MQEVEGSKPSLDKHSWSVHSGQIPLQSVVKCIRAYFYGECALKNLPLSFSFTKIANLTTFMRIIIKLQVQTISCIKLLVKSCSLMNVYQK